MFWQPEVTVPTLVCSTVSCLATAAVLVLWVLSDDPRKKRSLRYALVINLTAAEFINSLNNSISGAWVLAKVDLVPRGAACNFNGWLGQVSVQASDFSILAIAVVTFMTLSFNHWIADPSKRKIILICISVWIIPLITGTIAIALNKMEPVTGNWCWIAPQPIFLRYVLGHGWRIGIFVTVIVLYAVIFLRVRHRLTARKESQQQRFTVSYSKAEVTEVETSLRHAHDGIIMGHQPMTGTGSREDLGGRIERPPLMRSAFSFDSAAAVAQAETLKEGHSLKPRLRILNNSKLDQETWHWFLLSVFPLTYILVWLPGLANRFVELTGHNYRWLNALQATTQLTGLVNAMVYGLREHRGFWRRLNERYAQQY